MHDVREPPASAPLPPAPSWRVTSFLLIILGALAPGLAGISAVLIGLLGLPLAAGISARAWQMGTLAMAGAAIAALNCAVAALSLIAFATDATSVWIRPVIILVLGLVTVRAAWNLRQPQQTRPKPSARHRPRRTTRVGSAQSTESGSASHVGSLVMGRPPGRTRLASWPSPTAHPPRE